MKKTILTMALLCLLSAISYAQAYNSFTVNNSTSCTVYIMLGGNTNGGGCSPDYRSGVLAIMPGSTTFADPTMVPGQMYNSSSTPLSSSNDEFNFVEVYTSTPTAGNGCSTINAYNLSDCYPPSITSVPGAAFDDWNGSICNSCGTFDIDLTNVGSTLVLDIH